MNTLTVNWAVIGAGPAGIAAVGKLIDHGIDPQSIAWIDPEFKVGDFGTKWKNVSSNTKVKLFTRFFQACHSFKYDSVPSHFEIHQADPENTCLLGLAAQPLQWISDHLTSSVHAISAKVLDLKLFDRHWHLTLKDQHLRAKNVVVATGAEPKSLSFPDVKEIPLTTAMDPEKLIAECQPDDVVAVFGSSHSAIL